MNISRRNALRLAAAAALASTAGPLAATGEEPLALLILGGTSFLGPHLTEQALARGWRVTHFNRGRRAPDGVPGVETLIGDRDGRLEALAGRSWDAVIDTSGYVPRHVRLSAELLAPAVGHYLFVSTISVYASLAVPADEDQPVGRLEDESIEKVDGTTYGPLKALCEQAAREALPGRACVVRPGLIVGPLDPTDRFTYWPARAARGGEILAPNRPGDPLQFIDVRDLAAFILGLVERRVTGTFNAAAPPRRFTMGALLDACVSAAGSGASVTWVPAQFLAEQGVQAWTDMPAWFPPVGEEAAGALVPVDRALAAGLAIRGLDATVRDTLVWHLSRPPEQRDKLRAGLTAEREAQVLAAWHAAREGAGQAATTPVS